MLRYHYCYHLKWTKALFLPHIWQLQSVKFNRSQQSVILCGLHNVERKPIFYNVLRQLSEIINHLSFHQRHKRKRISYEFPIISNDKIITMCIGHFIYSKIVSIFVKHSIHTVYKPCISIICVYVNNFLFR